MPNSRDRASRIHRPDCQTALSLRAEPASTTHTQATCTQPNDRAPPHPFIRPPAHTCLNICPSQWVSPPPPAKSVWSRACLALRCLDLTSFTSSLPRAFDFDTHHTPPNTLTTLLTSSTADDNYRRSRSVSIPSPPPARFVFPLRTFSAPLDLGLDLGRAASPDTALEVLEVLRRRRPSRRSTERSSTPMRWTAGREQ